MIINKNKSKALTRQSFPQEILQTTSCFFKQAGFNLLTEQSLLNTYSFTDKLTLAKKNGLFNKEINVKNNHIASLLKESPINDKYLLNNWFEHHQLNHYKLEFLHSADWLKKFSTLQIPSVKTKDGIAIDE